MPVISSLLPPPPQYSWGTCVYDREVGVGRERYIFNIVITTHESLLLITNPSSLLLITDLEKMAKWLDTQLYMLLWLFWFQSVDLSWNFLMLYPFLFAIFHYSSYLRYALWPPTFLNEHLEPPELVEEENLVVGGQQDCIALTWSKIPVFLRLAYPGSARST